MRQAIDDGVRVLMEETGRLDLDAGWWKYEGAKFGFDGNAWFPQFKADLQKIYDAFAAAHRRDKNAYHQQFLRMKCSRTDIARFELGRKTYLGWNDFTDDCPVTFKDYLAENGYDVSVFGQ